MATKKDQLADQPTEEPSMLDRAIALRDAHRADRRSGRGRRIGPELTATQRLKIIYQRMDSARERGPVVLALAIEAGLRDLAKLGSPVDVEMFCARFGVHVPPGLARS